MRLDNYIETYGRAGSREVGKVRYNRRYHKYFYYACQLLSGVGLAFGVSKAY